MVVGGPLAVVVASMVTVFLAVSHPDPVLERPRSVTHGVSVNEQSDVGLEAQRSVLPATEARNHAASSSLPKDK